ncbi:MAG: hypothetical protein CL608_11945 [Anaerolineaceae bacterium]|nr:hypothetical protein [Anaerolineaceae bacterium]
MTQTCGTNLDHGVLVVGYGTQDGQEPVFIAQNGGESLWVNDHLLLFIAYDENFNAQLQQVDTLTGTRSVVILPDVFQIFSIVE